MRVPDEYVARVGDVDAVREGGDALAPDATEELALLVDHDHRVAL